MNIPPEWNTLVRGRQNPKSGAVGGENKRKHGSDEKKGSEDAKKATTSSSDEGGDMSVTAICHRISSAIRKSLLSGRQPVELDISYILQCTPYKDLVQSLFSEGSGVCAPHIPVVCRAYEESFLREKISEDEQLCIMQDKCEGNFIDPDIKFTCVRFILPGELDSSRAGLCVMCHRKHVQSLYYDMLYSGRAFRGIIQSYGNMSQKNEYCREDLLVCPVGAFTACMPFPIVSHHRSKYQAVCWSGVKQFVQKLSIPDF